MRRKEIDNMLCEELKGKLELLKTLDPGTDEYKNLLDDIYKLCKLVDGCNVREKNLDNILKAAGICVEVMGIVLPLLFYAKWMKEGFKFEETGTFTSATFRGLFQKFKTVR